MNEADTTSRRRARRALHERVLHALEERPRHPDARVADLDRDAVTLRREQHVHAAILGEARSIRQEVGDDLAHPIRITEVRATRGERASHPELDPIAHTRATREHFTLDETREVERRVAERDARVPEGDEVKEVLDEPQRGVALLRDDVHVPTRLVGQLEPLDELTEARDHV